MQDEVQRMQAALSQRTAEGVDAGRIADLAVLTWRDIDAALSPIIGQRGVAALYQRSLHLTRDGYPWLATVYESTLQEGDFTALQTALSQQTSSAAAAGNSTLLQTFCDLLSNLIGQSLTERLLESVWNDRSSDHAMRNTSL
jgi:hypothetical protein